MNHIQINTQFLYGDIDVPLALMEDLEGKAGDPNTMGKVVFDMHDAYIKSGNADHEVGLAWL